MATHPAPSFGEINSDTVGRWLHLAPEDDGPVWMLNLMRYRAVADYGDGAERGVSGREADDRYAPVAVLEDLGAVVALFADVTDQPAGEPAWDRIGIVRYPSRRTFFTMQNRKDFQEKYVHKEAGMDFTIVMGTVPEVVDETAEAGGPLVMRVRRFADGRRPTADPAGALAVARFSVDGVVVGDDRAWHEVRFDRPGAPTPGTTGAGADVEEEVVVVMEEPRIDALVASVVTAPDAG